LKRRQHAEADPCEHRHGRDEHHRQSVHTDVLEEWDAGAIEMRDQVRAAERPRPAPSAIRSAISLCRADARARSRFEMFAETSCIRNPTEAASSASVP
jgi:hypothetical protein